MIAQAATVLPRLLVVEDSPAAAGELCRLFEQHQFDVTHAQSGEEALSRLRESLPDALAIDSRLPDTSGDELCATIRRFQDWAHLPILLVLSADDPDTRVKGLTSGADDCIGRTDNSSELLARLRRLLARAEIHELLTEQEKLVTLRRAATTMAHCINNPLQILSMGIEMLAAEPYDPDGSRVLLDKMSHHLARIKEHVARLGEMVRIVADPVHDTSDLLDVSENNTRKRRFRLRTEPYRILMVDDDEATRLVVRKSLEMTRRFEVIEAANGREGLERARSELPDLILADLLMPEMDGFELCAALKSDSLLREIPIILLTMRRSMRDIIKALELGVSSYLVKPVDSLVLPEHIFRTLDRHGVAEPSWSLPGRP